MNLKSTFTFVQEVVYIIGLVWLTTTGADWVNYPDTMIATLGAAMLLVAFILFVDLVVLPAIHFVRTTIAKLRRLT